MRHAPPDVTARLLAGQAVDPALVYFRTVPTFETQGMTLLKRLTMIIDDGTITRVFYPVFPPDRNAADVVAWLATQRR